MLEDRFMANEWGANRLAVPAVRVETLLLRAFLSQGATSAFRAKLALGAWLAQDASEVYLTKGMLDISRGHR